MSIVRLFALVAVFALGVTGCPIGPQTDQKPMSSSEIECIVPTDGRAKGIAVDSDIVVRGIKIFKSKINLSAQIEKLVNISPVLYSWQVLDFSNCLAYRNKVITLEDRATFVNKSDEIYQQIIAAKANAYKLNCDSEIVTCLDVYRRIRFTGSGYSKNGERIDHAEIEDNIYLSKPQNIYTANATTFGNNVDVKVYDLNVSEDNAKEPDSIDACPGGSCKLSMGCQGSQSTSKNQVCLVKCSPRMCEPAT